MNTIPLSALLQHITQLPYVVADAEGDGQRAIVSAQPLGGMGQPVLIADGYANSTEDFDAPQDFRANTAYLTHAANVLPDVLLALKELNGVVQVLRGKRVLPKSICETILRAKAAAERAGSVPV